MWIHLAFLIGGDLEENCGLESVQGSTILGSSLHPQSGHYELLASNLRIPFLTTLGYCSKKTAF